VASHELRTPATAISGLATLLASRWDDSPRTTDAPSRAGSPPTPMRSTRSCRTCSTSPAWSEATSELALEPVDLSDASTGPVRLDGVWGSHGVSRDIEAGVEVLGDVNAIERIVTNLVSNAVKFSPADADVHGRVERRDGRARLLVDDAGPGVPEEEREKIFVRFFRGAGDAVVRTRGVGIGLSVVQDFVAQMGGSVHVEDSPSGGARFVVELDALDRSRERGARCCDDVSGCCPAAAFLALAAVGVLVLVLLTSAVDNGRQALEEAVLSEVEANARSQDLRIEIQNEQIDTLVGGRPSTSPGGQRGGRGGVRRPGGARRGQQHPHRLLPHRPRRHRHPGRSPRPRALGEPFDRAGADELLGTFQTDPQAAGRLAADGPGHHVRPPEHGVRAPDPGAGTNELRGTFVFESEVSVDSTFNVAFSELGTGRDRRAVPVRPGRGRHRGQQPVARRATGARRGASRPWSPGSTAATARCSRSPTSRPPAGGSPSPRTASEFDEGLTGPLQQVGLVIVAVFLVVGILSFLALARRLQAAREEQERLERLSETQEEFISIVSHELRTPVAGVLGFLQTTMDHWDAMTDTERFNALRRSASNARRLQGLTRDVLDSQAVESGRMSYAMGDADLPRRSTSPSRRRRRCTRASPSTAELDDPHVPVVVDVDRIQQVLTNLLDNAAKVVPAERHGHGAPPAGGRPGHGVGVRPRVPGSPRSCRTASSTSSSGARLERERHRPRALHLPPDPRRPRRRHHGRGGESGGRRSPSPCPSPRQRCPASFAGCSSRSSPRSPTSWSRPSLG
jgi:signal transduction histidine kinase